MDEPLFDGVSLRRGGEYPPVDDTAAGRNPQFENFALAFRAHGVVPQLPCISRSNGLVAAAMKNDQPRPKAVISWSLPPLSMLSAHRGEGAFHIVGGFIGEARVYADGGIEIGIDRPQDGR